MEALAKHVVLELNGCNRERLCDVDLLKHTLLAAADEAGATVVDHSFHVFPPYDGISGVVVVLESHLSVHTWPEHGYAAVDVFTCGTSVRPEKAVDLLVRELEPEDWSTVELKRGLLKPVAAHDGR